MIQFNIYNRDNEPPDLSRDVDLACDDYRTGGDVSQLAARLELLTVRHPNSLKLFLMFLRAKMWEGRSALGDSLSSVAIHTLKSHLEPPVHHFAQQEIIGILGLELYNQIRQTNDPLALAVNIHLFSISKKSVSFEFETSHRSLPIHFLPSTSGFFSIIENILLMDFHARISGRRLVLAPEKFWWPYEVTFRELFGDIFEVAEPCEVDGISWFPRDSAMLWLNELHAEHQFEFFKFKCFAYQRIRTRCENYLRLSSVSELKTDSSSVLFLRAGDKFLQETIPFPDHMIAFELGSLSTIGERALVLSDDYSLGKRLEMRFSGVNNISRTRMEGHTLGGNRHRQDVIEIIQNYLCLAKGKVVAGCPSSNLMNAANLTRLGSGCHVHTSDLFPVAAYLLL
jgi:hypothetical protein